LIDASLDSLSMADDEDTSAPAQVPEVDEVPLYEGDSGAVTTTG